ncbi:MAG: hypothetical protein H3C43_01120 [Leptonema sp. (in: Bacteria)]|nr:hypothetical protein [Leptonema sp. (in: bacteria)]
MQKFWKLYTFFGLVTLIGGCASTIQKGNEVEIHWWNQYGIYQIPPNFLDEFQSRHEFKDLQPIAFTNQGQLYRVPLESNQWLMKHGFKPITDVPFKYVDQEIDNRRDSLNPEIWFSGYKDTVITEKILAFFESSRPDLCSRSIIGYSVKGKPITALRISNQKPNNLRPKLLFNGAHHGNELLSIDYTLDLAAMLLDLELLPASKLMNKKIPLFTKFERQQILSNIDIYIVPMVNPDSVDNYWNRSIHLGRKNSNGVDLNRNYPFQWNSGQTGASSQLPSAHDYRGPRPASEPETKAMMKFADEQRFSIIFSYHTFATRVLYPYTIDSVMNPWPDRALYYATEFTKEAESYRIERHYEPARKLYSVDGTDQDWYFSQFGSLALIVEGSMDSPEYEAGIQSILGIRPIWMSAIREILNGPRIEVYVLSKNGLPIPNATVQILNEVNFENENWTVHPQTGRFDVLPGPFKQVDIQVKADGFEPQIKEKLSCSKICKEKFYLTQ